MSNLIVFEAGDSGELQKKRLKNARIYNDRIETEDTRGKPVVYRGSNISEHLMGDLLYMRIDPQLKQLEPVYRNTGLADFQTDPNVLKTLTGVEQRALENLRDLEQSLEIIRRSAQSDNYKKVLRHLKQSNSRFLNQRLHDALGMQVFAIKLDKSFEGAELLKVVISNPQTGKSIRVDAPLDLMAEPSILDTKAARRLGLDIEKCEDVALMGVGDSYAKSCWLTIECKGKSFTEEAVIWDNLHRRTGYHAMIGQKIYNYFKKNGGSLID